MRFLPNNIINSVVANATITSSPIDINQIIKMSAQVVVGSGTAGGSLQLQVSNDYTPAGAFFTNQVFTNWSNLGSAVTVTGAGATLIAQQDLCYRALRAIYTDTSTGTGTAKISVELVCLGI